MFDFMLACFNNERSEANDTRPQKHTTRYLAVQCVYRLSRGWVCIMCLFIAVMITLCSSGSVFNGNVF